MKFERILIEAYKNMNESEVEINYESILKEDIIDYSELEFKMDKYMPDEQELQEDYYKLISSNDKEELIMFFDDYADMDILNKYMPENGTLEDYINYLLANK